MSRQSRHGRFDVWLEIDGERAEQYGDGVNGRTSTCFIISRKGAELAIYVQEYPSMTSTYARATAYIEGNRVGKAVLSPSKGPCCFMGSWRDDHSLRPFVFTTAENIAYDENNQSVVEGSGTIVVKINEIVLLSKDNDEEELRKPPPELKGWQPPPVIDYDEDIERHSIVLSDTVKWQKYQPQLDVFQSKAFDEAKPEPIAVFEFVFGSKEFVLKSLEELKSSGSFIDSPVKTVATHTPEQLLANFGPPKKHARTIPATETRPSSRSANFKCTRCTNSGAECVPNGGTSLTCRRCRKLKQACDLPKRRHQVQEKRQRTNSKSFIDVPPKPRNFLGTKVSTSKNGINERESCVPIIAKGPVRFNAPEATYEDQNQPSTNEDEDSTYSPSDDVPLHNLSPRRLRRRSSSLGEADYKPSPPRAPKETQSYEDKKRNMSCVNHNGTSPPERMEIDSDKESESIVASSDQSNDTYQARTALQLIRSCSNQLMELVGDCDPDGVVADVSMQLVNNCDSASRRLQACMLQTKRARV